MNIAVIFAGGVGRRMRSKELPKQFLVIHGRPIIVRTLDVFQEHPSIDAIVVACVPDWIDHCQQLISQYGLNKVSKVVPGGSTGHESRYRALLAAKELAGNEPSVVLVHDGVRPLISEKTITDNIASVKKNGSAITIVRAKETLISLDEHDDITNVPDRSQVGIARAPQSFWLDEILEAYEWANGRGENDYIDSASIMYAMGRRLHAVEGPDENLKVTTPGDFFAMRAILDARENNQIYGVEEQV